MIRNARQEDAEEIVDLFKIILTDMELPIMKKAAWSDLKPALIEAVQEDAYRQSFRNTVVKDKNGKIAGFFFGYRGGLSDQAYEPLETILKAYGLPLFEIYSDSETFEGEWYLDSLVTHPEYRGQGIGKELMEAAYSKAKADGMSRIGLNVDHGNPRARKLYEQQGFRKTGEIVLADHRYDHMQKELD